MKISMTGISYKTAGVETRERFALTSSALTAALKTVRAEPDVLGCVLLSTCNRTELWISGEPWRSPQELLCGLRDPDGLTDRRLFSRRSDMEAVGHLLKLASGLESQVFGEDQIITQVGTALECARSAGTADSVLETLFRTAVTAAKKVKTDIRLTGGSRSAAESAADFLQTRLGGLSGVPCMVIGNGEMGRLAASVLTARGCSVCMTVRQYRHGEVGIPGGVRPISYDDRLKLLPGVRAVVSSTASPHYTMRAGEIGTLAHPTVFCDLAVPRDIDPAIGLLEGAELYDTDALCGGQNVRANGHAIADAQAILREAAAEFKRWYEFRAHLPAIREISSLAEDDLMNRIEKEFRRLSIPENEEEALEGRIRAAAGKMVGKLLFGLRGNLAPEYWEACLQGLQKSVRGEGTV